MTEQIPIRALTIFTAIIGVIMLALVAYPSNPAMGQSLPSVGFESSSINPSVQEPTYRVNIALTVELSLASNQTVTVNYATSDITATASTRDYTAASGTLYFSPGTTERTITVTALGDNAVENTERFRIQLSQPANATLGLHNIAHVTIRDDDVSAPYNISAPATVRESQGTFTVVVETASTPRVDQSFEFIVLATNLTAIKGTHYQEFNQIFEFPPGTTRTEHQLSLIDNQVDQENKNFQLNLLRNSADDDQIVLGVTQLTITILDDDPATPTNLALASQTTDDNLDHVAVLQWDYDDAEGYVLESRDGASGPWNCIVAGTYSSREPNGASTVSTTKGGAMAASEAWHFQVRNFTSQQSSYPGEATCDQDADYGYIFSTVDDQGYNLSPADTLGPVAIPAIDTTVKPTWEPTGLAVAAGAKHREVNISWDTPPEGSNVTGFALYRKWQGASDTPNLCLYWSTKPSEFITSYRDTHVAAYDDASNRNKYVYTVYPLNDAVPADRQAPGGCDGYRPGPTYTSKSITATLALSTDIFKNSDGDLEYMTPPTPTGLTLEPRLRGYRKDISTMRATWDDLNNAPGYKLRWRENGETDWREHNRSRKVEPNANACTGGDNPGTIESTLNDGRVWCVRENGKLLITTVTPWPWMFNAGPGKPNDNIAPARRGISVLKNNVRHEVQVATCTDQSCEGNGAWSSSRYAYSR